MMTPAWLGCRLLIRRFWVSTRNCVKLSRRTKFTMLLSSFATGGAGVFLMWLSRVKRGGVEVWEGQEAFSGETAKKPLGGGNPAELGLSKDMMSCNVHSSQTRQI